MARCWCMKVATIITFPRAITQQGKKCSAQIQKGTKMAKPNYSFEKRKKELERQKKKEEKKSRKTERNDDGTEINEDPEGAESTEEQAA